MKSSKDVSIILRWQYCHLFFLFKMAANSIDFIFFIWISYFQIHTTVALRRLVSLASCVSLKVRYEEIVKAIGKSLRRLIWRELVMMKKNKRLFKD